MATKRRIPVSRRALVQRIGRVLRERGQALKWYGARRRDEGRYALLDVGRGVVVASDVDVVKLARQLGVLAAWEEVTEGEARGKP
jgi:hypothetical protein